VPDPCFDGSGVALVTPFDEAGVKEPVLRELVRFHIAEHTDALIICGSTGEAAAMTPEEQRLAIDIAVDENAGRLPIIAGCGGSDTRVVARLAAQAHAAGADGLLVSAPPYNKPPQRGLVAHFRTVIEAGDLPTIVYNVPSRAAVNLLPATVMQIGEDPRVIGVKEASGDITQVAEMARLAQGRLALWSGNDDQVIPLMALGGRGVISVLANVAPATTSRMAHAFLDGDIALARRIQLDLLPLIGVLFAESNPIPVKAGVAWLGFDVGPPRPPLTTADPTICDRLVSALLAAGIERRA
jgi:4-hydroxy-tetrahydrodipicolinate synthase